MFQFLIPAAARIVGSRGIGRLISRIPGRPMQGPMRQQQITMDPSSIGPMTKGSRFQRYGGGIGDLGGGALEAGYGIDTFDDPEADLFDKAIGGALGLGGFGMMRRGGRRLLTSGRGGGREAQEAIMRENRPLAKLGQAKYALPLTGLQIGKEAITDDSDPMQISPAFSNETMQVINDLGVNPEQQKILDQFTKMYGTSDTSQWPVQGVNDMNNALIAAADSKAASTVNNNATVTTAPNLTPKQKKVRDEFKKGYDKTIIEDGGNPQIGIQEAHKGAVNALTTTDNPTGDVGGYKGYSQFGGSVGDLFSKLRIKKSDFQRSNDALEDYKNKIAEQRDKIKSFDEYKKAFTDYTGEDDDQSKNIALFKWAMNMMTGTTSQGGFAGLLDVAGKAGVEIADDLQAINAQEQAEKKQLVAQYMQYEQQANDTFDELERGALAQNIQQIQRTENLDIQERQKFIELYLDNLQKERKIEADLAKAEREANKPNKISMKRVPGNTATGYRTIKVARNESGDMLVEKWNPQTNSYQFVPAVGDDARALYNAPDIETDSKGMRSALANMTSASQGLKYVDEVFDILNKGEMDLGASAVTAKFGVQFGGVVKDVFGMMTNAVPGTVPGSLKDLADNNYNGQLQKLTMAQYADGNKATTGDSMDDILGRIEKDNKRLDRDVQALLSKEGYKSKAYKNAVSQMHPDYQDEFNNADANKKAEFARDIARLMIIENRMKYIIANANKSEDRLTQKDIDAAAASTQIFTFFGGADLSQARYATLRTELNQKFETAALAYESAGGSSDIIHSFENTEKVKNWKLKQRQRDPSFTSLTQGQQAIAKRNIEADVAQYLGGL